MHFRQKHLDFAAKITFLFLLAGFVLIAYASGGVDFRGYYGAAVVVTRGGNPYDYTQLAPVLEEITGFAGNNPYFYPPWFSLFFIPFTLLPFQIARLIWLVLNGGLFYFGLAFLQAALEWKIDGWKKWTVYLAATLSFAAYCLRSEQVGILLFFALALGLLAIKRRQYAVAGLALVLFVTKPSVTLPAAGIIVLWLVYRQRRSLLWAAGWTAGLILLSSVVISKWWQFDRSGFGRGLAYALDGPDQIAAVRVLSTIYDFLDFVLGVGPPFHYLIATALAISGVALVLVAWRQSRYLPTTLSAALVLTFLVTPYALQYDYVVLVLPFFWIVMHLPALENTLRAMTVGLLLFSFSVLIWQQWSYQGYFQLLALAGAFALTLHGVAKRSALPAQTPGSRSAPLEA